MRKRNLGSAAVVLTWGAVLIAGDAKKHDAAWVQERVDEIKKSEPPGWRKIPWAASLVEARKQSRDEKRPVFLFTHDGNMDTGRC
jgi:hypothetical protein